MIRNALTAAGLALSAIACNTADGQPDNIASSPGR
jgi:hypothetical protein